MTEFKGTKGPWRVTPNASYIEVDRAVNYDEAKNGGMIFTCHVMLNTYEHIVSRHFSEENYANAKLIAAAPDLLEASMGIQKIKELIIIPEENCPPEHRGEMEAIGKAIHILEMAIKKATE